MSDKKEQPEQPKKPEENKSNVYDGSKLNRGKSAGDRSKGPAPKKAEQKK